MTTEKRVIIVEDDKDINDLIAYNLRKEGFVVEQVFDGSDARKRLAEEVFNIVILDIMLPGIDGFDICREIKENPKQARTFIVVVSAKCRQQDKLYAHLLGADCYLTKPFSLLILLSAVKEISANLDKEFLVKNA
ncbi:response regulator transcription factor [bacterium]|nr:MAG: response regulator transcription factor [bacterium]